MDSLDLPEDAGFSTFMWHLYSKEKYTDAYFVLEYKGHTTSFSAHKFILALRSPHFAEEFYGEHEKKLENIILVTDVNPDAFKAMLNYMYDYMPVMKLPSMIHEVYKVAEQFQVNSLMALCKRNLSRLKITSANVFDMLEVSNYLQSTCTKDESLKFIQENTEEVMSLYKRSDISKEMISIFLSLKEISLDSVVDLFKWFFEWAESRVYEDEECDASWKAEKIREIVEEFLPQLPFASLSCKQFAELYKCHKEIFNESEVISIFMNFAIPGSQELPYWYNQKCKMQINMSRSVIQLWGEIPRDGVIILRGGDAHARISGS